MKDKTLLSITAISAIVVLEAVALFKGVDGLLLSTSLALIGGIAGYTIKGIKEKF